VVRGVGLGCSMMPSMAAAYLGVTRSGPPRDHGPQRAAACRRLDRHGPARGRPRGSDQGGDRLGTKRSFNLGCWTARHSCAFSIASRIRASTSSSRGALDRWPAAASPAAAGVGRPP
jgi:hypothetical protein